MDLSSSWTETWQDLGLAIPDPGLLENLLARYAEPHRVYHTRRHLEECLSSFASIRVECERPGEVRLALWFHDAIYDTRAGDNEAVSADWAERTLDAAGAAHSIGARVRALVLATKHDAMPVIADARWVCDVDLGILGSDHARFGEYEEQIRAEYSWVPEPEYRRARRAVLERLLDRPAIYATPHFRERLEALARANLGRALHRLRAA